MLFKSKELINYKKQLVREMLGTDKGGNAQCKELEEHYIPLKLLKYYSLGDNYQGVAKRKLWPLNKIMAGEKLWVVGKAGSGKTTLFRKLVLMQARDKSDSDKIPVYIDLRNLRQKEQGLTEHIVQIFKERGYSNPQKFINKKLQDGKFLLLLDGLDEISVQLDIREVLDKIKKFISEFEKNTNTILIASRCAQYNHDLDEMDKVSLSELSEQQIEKHVRGRLAKGGNPDKRLKELKDNIRLKRLARTPFGLSVICALSENQKELPLNQTGLYLVYVQHTLENLGSVWLESFSLENMLQVLEELAYTLHTHQCLDFDEEDFCQLAQETLSEQKFSAEQAAKLLTEVTKSRKLLTTCHTTNTYRFSHLSLQEFLAAQKLLHLPDGIRFILGKHNDRWWTTCIGFYAGLMNNPSGIIISLDEVNKEIALICFAGAKQVYPDLREVMHRNLVCGLIDTLHVGGLSQALVNQADSATTDLLKDILHNSSNLGLKVKCAQLLCEIGDAGSMKIILEELENSADTETTKCIVLGFDYLWSNPQPILDVLRDTDRQFLHRVQKELQIFDAEN